MFSVFLPGPFQTSADKVFVTQRSPQHFDPLFCGGDFGPSPHPCFKIRLFSLSLQDLTHLGFRAFPVPDVGFASMHSDPGVSPQLLNSGCHHMAQRLWFCTPNGCHQGRSKASLWDASSSAAPPKMHGALRRTGVASRGHPVHSLLLDESCGLSLQSAPKDRRRVLSGTSAQTGVLVAPLPPCPAPAAWLFLMWTSYALMPAMVVIVVSGSISVTARNACATHSHPDLGRQCILEGSCGSLHHWAQLLGDRLGRDSPDDFSCHDASHAASFRLESCHPSHLMPCTTSLGI